MSKCFLFIGEHPACWKGGVYLSQGWKGQKRNWIVIGHLSDLLMCYGENALLHAVVSPTGKTMAEAGSAYAPVVVHFNATINNTLKVKPPDKCLIQLAVGTIGVS